jgi:hypothetical protein
VSADGADADGKTSFASGWFSIATKDLDSQTSDIFENPIFILRSPLLRTRSHRKLLKIIPETKSLGSPMKLWPSFPVYFYCRSIGALAPSRLHSWERRVREYPQWCYQWVACVLRHQAIGFCVMCFIYTLLSLAEKRAVHKLTHCVLCQRLYF